MLATSMIYPLVYPLVTVAVSLLFALIATPIARHFAIKIGLVDHPDSHRKLHREAIALVGGPVLLTTLLATVASAVIFVPKLLTIFSGSLVEAFSLGLAALAIVALGITDDRFGLRGRQKLAGQVVICLSVIGFGFTIDSIHLFGWTFQLGLLTIPVTLLWLLLSINSVNLIDGADGLCSSVGWIACAALSVIGLWSNNLMESILAAAMAGALLGFLFYNLPPAKVFLGDSGSMLVGLILGVLAMRSWGSEATPISIAVPVVLMSVPLFDSFMAILRRKLTGRSVFTVDRGHLHHNLMRHGITHRTLVFVITLLSVITASGAVLGVIFKSDLISLGTMVFALGSLVITRVFGFAELELLCKRSMNFSKSLVVRRSLANESIEQQKVRLQGSRNWEIVWSTLVEFSEKHGIAKVSLDLNMPWLHEGFHANWQKSQMPEYSERWNVKLPIFSDERVIGRIEIVGHHRDANTYATLALLSELLESIQGEIEQLVNDFIDTQATSNNSNTVTDLTLEDTVTLPTQATSASA